MYYNRLFLVLIIACVNNTQGACFKNIINKTNNVLVNSKDTNKVTLKVYYECLCPGSRDFYVNSLLPTMKDLFSYTDLETLPFGNAEIDDSTNPVSFKCQHGEKECYGNMLHACAVDILNMSLSTIEFVACMMDDPSVNGSDDDTAQKCGKNLGVDAKPIIECAKSKRGSDLLLEYGRASIKVGFNYVPYVTLNGDEFTGDDLKKGLCDLLSNKPETCKQ